MSKKINTRNTPLCKEYWESRGFSGEESNFILLRKKNNKNTKETCIRLFGEDRGNLIWDIKGKIQVGPRYSPFSKEFWMEKGMTEQEADTKRNSLRPIKPEYWAAKGYTEEESIKLAADVKKDNNAKGAKGTKGITSTNVKYVKKPDYWTDMGYTIDEAREIISKSQHTFSLKKCIEKYGLLKGTHIWETRQRTWQNTLLSKTPDELLALNQSKIAISLDKFYSINDAITILNKTRGMSLVKSMDEFIELVKKDLTDYPNKVYYPIKKYFEKIPNIQKHILDMDITKFNDNFKDLFISDAVFYIPSRNRGYRMHTDIGLIRSSFEIYFYMQFHSLSLNNYYSLDIDKKYPNSNFRYDFRMYNTLESYTIEVCPMLKYDYSDEYSKKLQKKIELFGCLPLKTTKDIDNFLQRVVNNNAM